jgi:hypothetical protein
MSGSAFLQLFHMNLIDTHAIKDTLFTTQRSLLDWLDQPSHAWEPRPSACNFSSQGAQI